MSFLRWRDNGKHSFVTMQSPMARSEDLLIQPVGGESVIYDEKTKEAHCLKPLAAKVFELSDGHTTIEVLAARVSNDLGESVSADAVLDAVAQLEERGLMDLGPGLSRRDLIRTGAKVGATAAVAAPLISSVFASPAWAASSKTCGQLLCCTCFTGSGLNANDCCFIRNVTQNCECTNAGGNSCKFCKPSGTGAPSDADCQAAWNCGGTTGVSCNPSINNGLPLTKAVCNSVSAKGAACNCGCACGHCSDPSPC